MWLSETDSSNQEDGKSKKKYCKNGCPLNSPKEKVSVSLGHQCKRHWDPWAPSKRTRLLCDFWSAECLGLRAKEQGCFVISGQQTDVTQ